MLDKRNLALQMKLETLDFGKPFENLIEMTVQKLQLSLWEDESTKFGRGELT